MLKQVQHDNKMKIKVCGMREAQNIEELIKLAPDYIGFIFYDKSKRAVAKFPKTVCAVLLAR